MSNSNTFSRDNKAAKANKGVAKPKDKIIGNSSTEDWLDAFDDHVSMMGYRDYSPYRDRSSIDIYTPTGMIDMSETGIPLMANGQYLPPYSGIHDMGTPYVREERIPKAQTGLEYVTPLGSTYIFDKNNLNDKFLQNRAAQCHKGECLAGANMYYNKYVAPTFGLPDTWKMNEAYGIVSGDPNQPYGKSMDSWDAAAEMQAKGAIQNYAARLYDQDSRGRKIRRNEDAAGYDWDEKTPEEKKKIYSGMALGTLVNFGDWGGVHGERLEGSNEKAGLYPSRHSARVVGFTRDGEPVVYDYGELKVLSEAGLGHPITNITTPKELQQYTYDYLKDWQYKNNKELNYDPKEKLILTKGSQRAGEDPFTDEEFKYVEGINKNIKNLMAITGASQDDIIKAGKVAFGIMQGETRGGRGAPKAMLKEITKFLVDPTGITLGEPSKGFTRIKPVMRQINTLNT
jgi:hypothetical protein